ncbi:nucleotide exchange factor GrpE [Spiroplasma turonicum]|uniref:Protein GrpE n=1 Tax=Spiroplasma turonicum TaxID=216946 RepID=A0A0K1P840_9MOLU|nr:nucleotide exchange factor GrpE [Spiroplasma turonicum]AKU80042.1 molecular chaperone GrpE (heat shock protein) [Spiroplasma turonicum]ALX71044.1 molecular chaperone GrpE (heat shock protein) [Spiroplasma turonicum]
MEPKNSKELFDLIDKLKREINGNIENEKQKVNKNIKNQEKLDQEKTEIDNELKEEKEISDIEKLEYWIVDLVEKNQKLEEEKLMAVADSQNTVKRFQNEYLNIKKYAGEKLASNILPAIDMFRSVLNSSPENPEIKNYLMGFEMIVSQIDQALSNSGISRIDVKEGDDFDPELHSAIEQIETEKFSSGKITNVISNGYKLHDRVIKHANVKVAK